jgi:hypothetical protein
MNTVAPADDHVLVSATTAALATAVLALGCLLVGAAAAEAGQPHIARVGLACLFAVPVVRNVTVVVFGAGRDRVLAVVGIAVIVAVGAAAAVVGAGGVDEAAEAAEADVVLPLAAPPDVPLDRATPTLPTSTP